MRGAALDRGLVQDVEAALEGAEGLGLRESLQKSINPPFALLAEKLGGDVLGEYAERSGLIEGKIPKGWMRGGGKEAVHGGELKTTIRREHQMAVGVDEGRGPVGWGGRKKATGGTGLGRGEDFAAGKDRILRGVSLDDGLWAGEGGDGISGGACFPKARDFKSVFWAVGSWTHPPVIEKSSLISLGWRLWDAFRFSTLSAS